ncbi:MAG TPA: DUF6285 domain-containing protein [Solirubrobacterales bacterium]|jgi:hypothetical protein|nr:DUF6285 domain-containing protein [Solirubrobacterales bacterium]
MTQDRPDAAELLEAVGEYLFAELRPEAPREQRFRVLVAANVCAVVARELRAGEQPYRADLELLRELLGDEGGEDQGGVGGGTDGQTQAGEEESALRQAVRAAQSELARRLRRGELDDRLDEVGGRLAEHVRRKLDVARPGYDEHA